MTGVIYRRLRALPACKEDFYSHRETNTPCPAPDCDCWGLSVWLKIEDVRHALKVYRAFRNSPIVKVNIKPENGVIMHTGSNRQPEHRTFWRDITHDLLPLCVVIDPQNEEGG